MPERKKKLHTVLNFCCDRVALNLRGWFLNDAGYRVLNSSNGFEAIELSTCEQVDAAVLDMDHNHAEVTLIVKEIKRLRPQVATVVITERTAPEDAVWELSDALVAKKDGPEMLVKSLGRLLAPAEHTNAVA